MRKSLWKATLVVVTGIIAITVCFIGYRRMRTKQDTQRIDYSKITVNQTCDDLKEINQQINNLYEDENHTLLKPGVAEDDVINIESEFENSIDSIDALNNDAKDLSKKIRQIYNRQKKIEKSLKSTRAFFNRQHEVDNLFIKPVSNWKKAEDNVVIRENLSNIQLKRVKKIVAASSNTTWRPVAEDYLSFAADQVQRVTLIESEIDKMLKKGKITDYATYSTY